ncbi:hypothetical protein EQP59_05150 [Ornithobacterium rhinotracheale]|uniref:Uncharacterized protein n=1 Tax=Ornithobacterium rhinotracheale TaxID=28251 RepID=A0A410JRK8_ORNRH|nr:hypothetical protein [Ornithobacterium rhinotracheale]QAR30766.1 hypothetical protein EQP59_05150 [Ornithobacterium rhinotracheale]
MKINNIQKSLYFFLTLLIVLIIYFVYNFTRPTIIFHTHNKEIGYLGKIVNLDGNIYKLYVQNHISQYKLPHIWDWDNEDQVAIFTHNYNDLLTKKEIDFWKLEIYLDEEGKYKNHIKTRYFWQK